MAVVKGVAIIDFGSTPSAEAQVTVTGQTSALADDKIEAFFMRDTQGENGPDEHEGMATFCRLVCGEIVVGTSFVIRALMLVGEATGEFKAHWARTTA